MSARPPAPSWLKPFASWYVEVDGDHRTARAAPVVTADQRSFTGSVRHFADVHRIRSGLARWLDGRATSDTILVAQLVASELLTNAVEHGGAGDVALEASLESDQLSMTVAHSLPAELAEFTLEREMPDAESRRSRGLALVQRLSNSVRREWHEGTLSITVVVDC